MYKIFQINSFNCYSTGKIMKELNFVINSNSDFVGIYAYGRGTKDNKGIKIGNKFSVCFDGIKTRILDNAGLNSNLSTILLINKIKKYNPDIIHFLYPNPYAAYFFLKYDYKGVLHLDWICDIVKQKITRIFFESQTKKLLNKADFVTSITPTYFENTDFLPKYHGEKGFIACRIGDARTKITEEQKNKSRRIKEQFANKKIVFFFGRHTEYKGLKYLIEANKFLDQTKIEIIIAGKGELTKKLMKQSKKYSNIKFVGRLSDNDINSYLLACDIFAFPSITRNEAFGISLAEAMYFGKPACTFTIPGSGVNWVSINGQTCLEAQNKNVLQFANNITKLSNDSKLYATLSINSKKRCNSLFTKDKFDFDVVQVYSKITSKYLKKFDNL